MTMNTPYTQVARRVPSSISSLALANAMASDAQAIGPGASCSAQATGQTMSVAEVPTARCCAWGGGGGICLVKPHIVLSRVTLSFSTSKDQEYVRIRLVSDGLNVDLGARLHNFLLLVLARRRLADAAEGLVDTSCGWIYTDDLAHDPSMTPLRLNLDVHRIRRHLGAYGVVDAASVLERRAGTKQLRIGTGRLAIVTL